MTLKSLLWIVPKWPLPANDGARVATANLLRALAHRGIAIDLVAVAGHDEVIDEQELVRVLGVRSASVVRRGNAPKSPLGKFFDFARSLLFSPRTPLTMRHYATREVREGLKIIMDKRGRGTGGIVYDGLHPAIHSCLDGKFSPPLGSTPIIYRAHNREAGIWERLATSTTNPIKKALITYQAKLVRGIEESLVKHSRMVATVSEEDLVGFCTEVPVIKGGVVPIGYEFGEVPPLPPEGSVVVLFLARLDWPPNREGLIWFLDEVWPKVADSRPDMELVVAGSGDAAPLLERLNKAPRCRFLGKVPEVAPLYRESHLSLVPIFYGSGTRVKAIEASRYGRPTLSTTIGVEGLGLQPGTSYLHGETAVEWIELLVSLSQEDIARIGRTAHDTLLESFDLDKTAVKFISLVEEFS